MKVGPRVGIRLSHITEVRARTTYYRLQTAWVDRPPAGSRTGRLRCATCGEMVPFRVRSEAITKARKRNILAVLLPALAVFGGAIAAVAVGGGNLGYSVLAWLGVGIACGSVVSITSALILFREDGVTATHIRQPMGPHRLKPVNSIEAMGKPPTADSLSRAEITFDD